MDQVLDSLGKGRVFSLLDPVSSFDQITALKDTVHFTEFCAHTGLYEWLVMPLGSSASPGWFGKVVNEVVQGLEQVTAYVDDVSVFDSDPTAHANTMLAPPPVRIDIYLWHFLRLVARRTRQVLCRIKHGLIQRE